jgi:hypothetical protein
MGKYNSILRGGVTEKIQPMVDNFFIFRVLLATASASWAILLALTLVDATPHLISPTQDLLNLVMPMYSWMILFGIQSMFGFAGLLFSPKSKWFVLFDSMLAALLWLTTTSIMLVGYFVQDHNFPPVWASQITITVFAVWALFRNNYDK